MKNHKFTVNIHLILRALIAIILIVVIFKLVRWNIGTKSDYDPNYINPEFLTEALDVIFKTDPTKYDTYVEDGVKSILFVGNNPLSDAPGENGIPYQTAALTGVYVASAAFAETCLSAVTNTYSEDNPMDAFSLYYLTKAMCTGDYSLQEELISSGRVGKEFETGLNVLQNVNYASLDVLVIMYDANDYLQKRNLYDENDDENFGTYCGALRASVNLLKETYPHTRIIVMSPYFANAVGEDGSLQSGDTTNFGCGTIPDYLLMSVDIANEKIFTLIDNYYGTINENIASEYLADNIHLNDAGRTLLAERLSKVIGLKDAE